MYSKKHRFIAKTLHNLENVLANELNELGAEEVEIGRRAVSFVGDKALLYKANLRLRTALRILKPLHTFKAKNPDELYEVLLHFDWSSVMRVDQSFSIDTTVFSDVFTHSKFVSYRAKDAIVDYWQQSVGKRPNVSIDAPDIYINVHIAHNEVTLSLDSSGESLHKRGYRDTQTDAPINEVLAAGILLKAGWDGSCDLIDPMCGSGTFLIEAALIARNIAPGIYRKGFAFEQWLDYDAGLFEELYNDDSAELEFEHKIYGGDILPHAIRVSDSNVRRAGVSRYVQLDIIPFESRTAPAEPALIVMNPPYGERLKLRSAEELYSMIGERLKHNYAGCKAWVIAYKTEHFDSIGLRHSSRTEMMNGSLECELRGYELFSGKRDEYKRNQANSEGEEGERQPRERRPFGDRRGAAESRPRRFGDERRERKLFAGRPERSDRPSFSRDRDGERRERPAFTREARGERRERPAFTRERDGERQERKPFAGRPERSDRPSFSRDRDGERRERPAFARDARGDRRERPAFSGERRGERPFRREGREPERSERRFDKPREGGRRADNQLWPSDRFNYTDAEGNIKRRQPRSTTIQVFRSEDKK